MSSYACQLYPLWGVPLPCFSKCGQQTHGSLLEMQNLGPPWTYRACSQHPQVSGILQLGSVALHFSPHPDTLASASAVGGESSLPHLTGQVDFCPGLLSLILSTKAALSSKTRWLKSDAFPGSHGLLSWGSALRSFPISSAPSVLWVWHVHDNTLLALNIILYHGRARCAPGHSPR